MSVGQAGVAPWRAWLARGLYATALRLATPLYLLRLLWRSRSEPLYRHALGERLGFGATQRPGRVWVHAVSLGEARAAATLIDALRQLRPEVRLLLTHGTATGRAAGKALLRADDAQAWLPYDTPGAVRRFLARQRPAVLVLMETEVWPVLLHEAARAGVSVVLANARLSPRSLEKAQRLPALMRPAAACLTRVLAQTADDAARLRSAGAREVQVMGNLKFDMQPALPHLALGRAWRETLGRRVVIAASTREGEEAALLAAWPQRAAQGPGNAARPVLLIVPRHPQRFDEVAALVAARGLTLSRRSAWGTPPQASTGPAQADVWLGDSLGEMAMYYAMADVALLGGSFAPLGGQNLIEAAACGCPLVMGPHTFNFAEAAELALAAGAARRVQNMGEGVREALRLLRSPQCAQMARQAQDFAATHRGAAERMARQVVGLLGQPTTRALFSRATGPVA